MVLCPLHALPSTMGLNWGSMRRTSVELAPSKTLPVLQPLAQPPLRHWLSAKAWAELAPPAVLCVDVVSLAFSPQAAGTDGSTHVVDSNKIALVAPELLVVLGLEQVEQGRAAGPWGIRTRAVPANPAQTDNGEVVRWQEQLVIGLPPSRAGPVKVQVELWDQDAEGGAGSCLSKTMACLDLDTWQPREFISAMLHLRLPEGFAVRPP